MGGDFLKRDKLVVVMIQKEVQFSIKDGLSPQKKKKKKKKKKHIYMRKS